MLKNIADEFYFATTKTFKKCKVFFVHAASERMYLWSLHFEPKGPLFELWLEDSLWIKSDTNDKLEVLPCFSKFFWGMKQLLSEALNTYSLLRTEHCASIYNNLFYSTLPSDTLSTTVNPSILKLLEEGTYLKDSLEWTEAGFCRGEAQLQSMNSQLKTLPLYDDESHTYLADGIIKLLRLKDIEMLFLETSSPFANTVKAKNRVRLSQGSLRSPCNAKDCCGSAPPSQSKYV
ncbi:hypothetical protein EDC94DRAFT_606280 [Helicostylum pulchrum]|nr:hypothetical protein EDC94DRAFT_606280 [Helicostylum pulchrum]